MPIYEAALGIILAMLAGILFVSPICLFERYILWETLDEYIDSTVIKIIACVAVNAVIFLIGCAIILAIARYNNG